MRSLYHTTSKSICERIVIKGFNPPDEKGIIKQGLFSSLECLAYWIYEIKSFHRRTEETAVVMFNYNEEKICEGFYDKRPSYNWGNPLLFEFLIRENKKTNFPLKEKFQLIKKDNALKESREALAKVYRKILKRPAPKIDLELWTQNFASYDYKLLDKVGYLKCYLDRPKESVKFNPDSSLVHLCSSILLNYSKAYTFECALAWKKLGYEDLYYKLMKNHKVAKWPEKYSIYTEGPIEDIEYDYVDLLAYLHIE